MFQTQNFIIIAVIMERFSTFSHQSFIEECFANHPEEHRKHLRLKYQQSGNNILSFLPYLDLEHLAEVNKFLNGLIKPHERHDYDYSWELIKE